jgi:hypothetical protein
VVLILFSLNEIFSGFTSGKYVRAYKKADSDRSSVWFMLFDKLSIGLRRNSKSNGAIR